MCLTCYLTCYMLHVTLHGCCHHILTTVAIVCHSAILYGSQQLFHQLCKCVTRFSKTSLLLLPCQQWPTHTHLAILCLTLHRATGHPAFLNHATMLLCRNACPFSIMILCHHAQLLTLLSCLCAIIASKPSYLNLQLAVPL